jgi:hypothetical protein
MTNQSPSLNALWTRLTPNHAGAAYLDSDLRESMVDWAAAADSLASLVEGAGPVRKLLDDCVGSGLAPDSGSLLVGLLERLEAHGFATSSDQLTRTGRALYLSVSLFNHSCAPNCGFSRRGSGGLMAVHAMRSVPFRGQCTISYTGDLLLPTNDRRRMLLEEHCFHCCCERCEEGGGGLNDAMFSGFSCCGLAGVAVVTAAPGRAPRIACQLCGRGQAQSSSELADRKKDLQLCGDGLSRAFRDAAQRLEILTTLNAGPFQRLHPLHSARLIGQGLLATGVLPTSGAELQLVGASAATDLLRCMKHVLRWPELALSEGEVDQLGFASAEALGGSTPCSTALDQLGPVPGALANLSDDQIAHLRALLDTEASRRSQLRRTLQQSSLGLAAAGDGRPLLDALNLASLHGLVARCLITAQYLEGGGEVHSTTVRDHLAQRWLLLSRLREDGHPETAAAWSALVLASHRTCDC